LAFCALLGVSDWTQPALGKQAGAAVPTQEASPGSSTTDPKVIYAPNSRPDSDASGLSVRNSSLDATSVYHKTLPKNFLFADNVRSTVYLDDVGAGSVQHMAAYGAYVYNRCKWGRAPHECNGVGLFSQAIAGVASAQTWPINTACNDNGLPSSCGNEHDITVQSEAAVYTLWAGIIQGAVQPGNANGIQLSQVPGALAQWTYGFTTGDGAAKNFASVGAAARRGANVPSQPLWMNSFDRTGETHAIKLQALDHALEISDNTRDDGIALATGGGTSTIRAIGRSADVGLELRPKGAGAVTIPAPVKFADGSGWSDKGLVTATNLELNGHSVQNAATLKLIPITFAQLPLCNASTQGTIAFIKDAREPITTWHQAVDKGAGIHRAFVSCNGAGWHAFDY